MSQSHLFKSRRFWPMFWTQFLGAFNDNLFKNALVLLITYKSVQIAALESKMLVQISAGVFILPFALFSASAGQLGDKYSKSAMIRWIKFAEIVIMSVAAIGFYFENYLILLITLFLMGAQSSFFGPAKYSILPELLEEQELVGGNALVETGTFISILLGTIAGGIFVGAGWVFWIGVVVVSLACLGFFVSLFIQKTPQVAADLKVHFNPILPTLETFRATRTNRTVFLSILGIAWFWFFGASVLTLMPTYGKELLGADESVTTFFLAMFCTGIAIGSLLCGKLSAKRLELGLVPLGSIGISLFTLDLFLVGDPFIKENGILLTLGQFLEHGSGVRIAFDFLLLSVFSGFYTVPLYTIVQERSDPRNRSRVIAGNNIINAFFMVVSAGMLIVLGKLGFSIPQIFLVLAVLNAAVAFYIYSMIPEFMLRFIAWIRSK